MSSFPGALISSAALADDPPREGLPLGPLLSPLLPSGLGCGEVALIVGPPGVGKSVLAMAVLASLGGES
ncbi:Uncharacterised protein [Mycobacteroides abscessus subsp. abscessus]|nr:Uncharacterised protein [Mycobacteroides abscessus subsp. abscessus]SHS87508.1 Uncharacterised protein [Mycobacteroides abscessus subsp. abscessus]SHT71026.1 Uncharacterised protein [Mycobacteroides abscessus subsp. abscessus]SHU92133.1 Uncharacterised protein [Mycobacteroides abscessus subsp. abscessus]SHX08149.1 Uncharacterised protein [Mycobacteroides abscessus subsp. abscessus]